MNQEIKKTRLSIPVNDVKLPGDLALPFQSSSLVIFAHGSGSSRLSTRNQAVADYLNRRGMATLLFDLLTPAEDREYKNRFNIELLSSRLEVVSAWVHAREECKDLKLGFFGASTGAAAALMASGELPEVKAIVSRGGRPDLAMQALPGITAATLLIVGGQDTEVLQLNQQAYDRLTCSKRLEIVPGATHLFEEEGAMEKVCFLAGNWFELHLQPVEISR